MVLSPLSRLGCMVLALASCAALAGPPRSDDDAVAASMRAAFEAKKQATMDRLEQDETQKLPGRRAPR